MSATTSTSEPPAPAASESHAPSTMPVTSEATRVPAAPLAGRCDLITVNHPRSAVSEAYRELRTSLQFSRVDESLRVVMVTSSGPAEGKSTTVSNLAVTMAQAGSRVLAVDADLRRASLDKYFGLSNQFGLTNALFDQANLNLYIRSTPIERLHILTSGPLPPNPSELLGSQKMKDLLRSLRERFDFVILDTPPVGSVSDALVLSPSVDGVVLVVHAGGLPREVVQRVKGRLDHSQARVLGVVLNKVDIEREQPYYFYYNYASPYYASPTDGPR